MPMIRARGIVPLRIGCFVSLALDAYLLFSSSTLTSSSPSKKITPPCSSSWCFRGLQYSRHPHVPKRCSRYSHTSPSFPHFLSTGIQAANSLRMILTGTVTES